MYTHTFWKNNKIMVQLHCHT